MSSSFGLGSTPGLDEETWKASSRDERLGALQKLENVLAERQNRASCNVVSMSLPNGTLGQIDSVFSENLFIDHGLLDQDDPKIAVDTVVHEGRHAFQIDCVRSPSRHPDISEKTIEVWEDNLANYVSRTEDPIKYVGQPVEVDARSFAKSVTDTMYPERRNEVNPTFSAIATVSPYEYLKPESADPDLMNQDDWAKSHDTWTSDMQRTADAARFSSSLHSFENSSELTKGHEQMHPSAQNVDVDPWLTEQRSVRESAKFSAPPPPAPEPQTQSKGMSI